MTRLALLLRGINVGGNNTIAMANLRELFSNLGYEDPKTLLNSGNAVVTTADKPAAAERRVHESIKCELGLSIAVLARTHQELADIVAANPLGELATKLNYYVVAFLDRAPQAGALKAVDPQAYAPEQWTLIGRELYVWYANGMGRTKLSAAFWEKQLKVTATARNWNTVVKLHDLTA